MSFTDWMSKQGAAEQLYAQAQATAKQLGHFLTGFVIRQDGTHVARCLGCDEFARVRPRTMHGLPITGEATRIRCAKPYKSPPPTPAPPPNPWAIMFGPPPPTKP